MSEDKSLTSLDLEVEYSSDEVGLVPAFYTPCLERAVLYRRAVGYFTSHGLVCAAQGIASLLNNGGRIRLIASPLLNEADIEAINKGYRDRDDVILNASALSLQEVEGRIATSRLSALSWMIASELLEVHLAIRLDENGAISHGQYHEKIGIISDEQGNHVAFSGSPNETSGGLIDNFESIDVFWSWDDPHRRVDKKIQRFEDLWSNNTSGLSVINFTDASRELLEKYKQVYKPRLDPVEQGVSEKTPSQDQPSTPSNVELRGYQRNAINSWLGQSGVGIMKMATGTGKTITALSCAVRLLNASKISALIIVCPYQHLVTQWEAECVRFNIRTATCFQQRRNWEPILDNILYNIQAGQSDYGACIVTNATFISDGFQKKLQFFPANTLIIADEVHNLGAKNARTKLPEQIPLRLGLSATPDRWFDEEGTRAIYDYFGEICIDLGLKEALDIGALCKYRYYPILVELTEDEQYEYLELSQKISRLMSQAESIEDEDSPLASLLIKRARLVATAENKVIELEKLMRGKREVSNTLFYCGDGSMSSPSTQEELKQIKVITQLLGSDLGLRVATYTAETSVQDRKQRLSDLECGLLQGLIAIKCLDEGVDLPSIDTAVILASSTNPRQFIQRRGRILRNYPGKKDAAIYDMLVVPPEQTHTMPSERALMEKELRRLAEFADLALNPGEAREVVWELQKNLGLTDI